MQAERTRRLNIDALQMENELLGYENRYLRARLGALGGATATPEAPASKEDPKFRQAFYDLRWLLQRVAKTPAGRVVRLWAGWRTLEERYLR